MNKINFLGKENFPVSTNTLDMMQKMIQESAQAALLGGSNYILKGCTAVGSTTSEGVVVINGEVLPFVGGETKSKVTIRETYKALTAFGVEYPEAYAYRNAIFDNNGEYNWGEFTQVLTNKELQTRIEAIKGDEPGMVKMWSGRISRIPNEYRLCDGSLLTIADYPELYDNIGISFGGNGVTDFRLPDIRGRFVVGYDSTSPEYNHISSSNTGGVNKVTLTTEQIPEHDHVKNVLFNRLSARASDIDELATPGSIDDVTPSREYNVGSMSEDRWRDATIQKVGGGQEHENRPPYYVLAYIIKVK